VRGHITPGRAPRTWYLRVELPPGIDGKRRQRREAVVGTKAEAQQRLRALLHDVETGGFGDVARLTVAELCERWLVTVERRVGTRCFVRYRQIVHQYVAPQLGTLRAEKLRPAHIEAALAAWSKSSIKRKRATQLISARSVRHVFDTLKAALRWGVRMGLLVRNPVDALEAPRWEQREMKTLDLAGVAALLRAAEGTELHLPIAVLVGTGVRRGELFGLRWTDIDLDAGRLTVKRSVEMIDGRRREKPPKTTRSARTLALASFVVAALRQQKAEQSERRLFFGLGRDENAYVFDRADCEPTNPDSFSWSFAELVRRAKLPKVRLHDLRHSHATIALAAGTDLKTISAALGHSTIAVTANTYLHATEALQRSHADRIDAALSGVMKASNEAVSGGSVPQRCHKIALDAKKPRGYRVSMVAPTGFEPVLPP